MRDSDPPRERCPDRETMAGFLLGSLPEPEHEWVMDHVDACGPCQARLAESETHSDEFLASLWRPSSGEPFEEEFECASSVARAERLIDTLGDEGDTPAAPDERRAEPPLEIERIGPYRLLRRLGAGGMGTVYKALHTKLDRVVALKVLNSSRLGDPDAVARFEREMKAIGRLDHPHLVRATDADEDDGQQYLVMEFVDGIDLSRLQRRLGPLPPAEASELIRQAAVGLQYVHEQGLVHRDLKPSNLMLGVEESGRGVGSRKREVGSGGAVVGEVAPTPAVKILDLGLARLGAEGGERELTSTGQVMGTLDYMAPEQVDNTHGVDIRADIYSLGATLYKLLTGRAPLSGKKPQTSLQKIVALARDEAPSVSTLRHDLPAGLTTAVDRMLSRDPARRFATPAEVADALAPFAQEADLAGLWEKAQSSENPGAISGSGQAPPPERVADTARPRRTKAILASAVALVLVAVPIAIWAIGRAGDRPGTSTVDTSRAATEGDRLSPDRSPRMVTLPNGWQIGAAVNLGPPVNGPWDDGHPSVSADGCVFLFESNRPGGSGKNDTWISTRASTQDPWGEPIPLRWPGGSLASMFGAAISADGLTLLISSSRPGGQGREDLWQSTRTAADAPWSEPVNLGPVVNSDAMEVSPSLSDNGLTLLFASNRGDDPGASRLWMSTRPSTDHPWGEPFELAPPVNGGQSDGGPDLSADGLAIVFESRRTGCIGVGDLWMSTRRSLDAAWSEPVNLGPQVNTPSWDAGPCLAINDTVLFFGTRGLEGHGGADVWMAPVKRPEPEPAGDRRE